MVSPRRATWKGQVKTLTVCSEVVEGSARPRERGRGEDTGFPHTPVLKSKSLMLLTFKGLLLLSFTLLPIAFTADELPVCLSEAGAGFSHLLLSRSSKQFFFFL